MYRRKMEKNYIYVIIAVIVCLIIVLIALAFRKDGKLTFIQKGLKDTGNFIVNIVSAPVNFAKGIVGDSKDRRSVADNYEKINDKAKEYDKLKAENDNLKDEVKSLKKELGLKNTLSEYNKITATVINRNMDYWYQDMTINKGSKDGINKGDAVVNSSGLVGSIQKVSSHTSTVKLISNENISDKISVKIDINGNYAYGLISGYKASDNTFTVEGISEDLKITKGSKVLTTGMGDHYPSGILVGTVTKVTTDNFDLSKIALVKGSTDFNDLDYVSVLKRQA